MAVLFCGANALAQPAGAGPAPVAALAAEPPDAEADKAPARAPVIGEAAQAWAKSKADAFFKNGKKLFDKGEYAGALVEYQAAFRIAPTKAARASVGACLLKLQRFDEALEAFEATLRDYGAALPPKMKEEVLRQIDILRAVTGAVVITGAELGALIVIDGRLRGEHPAPTPLSVLAGPHFVRVYKEGFAPFEKSIEVAQGQTASLKASLAPLGNSGTLRIEESSGKVLDVVVDGMPVGATPWEGPLSVGDHNVLLRSQDNVGTQPSSVTIRHKETTRIQLTAEPLGASIKVVPIPATATVLIDAFPVGRGAFEGRLRTGEHSIKVVADGYFDRAQKVSVKAGDDKALSIQLERDPSAPLWQKPGRFTVQALGGFALVPSLGGDVVAGCTGGCSQGVGLGSHVVVHIDYEQGNGLGLGVSFGYLSVAQDIVGRKTTLIPEGLDVDHGVVDDTLKLRGFRPGVSVSYRFGGERFPIRIRLGAGALLGSISDTRTGSFRPGGKPIDCPGLGVEAGSQSTSPCFTIGPVIRAPFAGFLFVEPEVRVGFRLDEHVELSAGLAALLLFGRTVPSWDDEQGIYAGKDGIATFKSERLAGSVIPLLLPGLSARYAF
ncbi:PEGA domain-containing protein [Sorangium cellulosum]|uniref:PEGA domain-containing protein n=1 Tax=Sorangium cellulosum TaxID=56 RepID=UPI003D9A4757